MRQKNFRFKSFDLDLSEQVMALTSDAIALGAWSSTVGGATKILDIGTGTGVLALMLAQKYQGSQDHKILAIDIHPDSCHLAKTNFENSPWNSHLEVVEKTLSLLTKEEQNAYDHIIVNPPFFKTGIRSTDQMKRRSRHFNGGTLEDWIDQIKVLLSDSGICSMVFPWHNYENLVAYFKSIDLHISRVLLMKGKKEKETERVFFEFGKTAVNEYKTQNIIMYESEGIYTKNYMELTKDFYLEKS